MRLQFVQNARARDAFMQFVPPSRYFVICFGEKIQFYLLFVPGRDSPPLFLHDILLSVLEERCSFTLSSCPGETQLQRHRQHTARRMPNSTHTTAARMKPPAIYCPLQIRAMSACFGLSQGDLEWEYPLYCCTRVFSHTIFIRQTFAMRPQFDQIFA